MIKINLLPVRQIKKIASARNELIALLLGFVAVLLILWAVGYMQTQKIESLNVEISKLQAEKAKYDSVIKQIAKIEREKKILETKLKVIKDLQADSQIPVRIVNEIANLTPSARIWLKSMKLTGKSLILSAVALDNATIAQYMLTIEKSPYFIKAELKSSSKIKVGEQNLKSFGLTITVQ